MHMYDIIPHISVCICICVCVCVCFSDLKLHTRRLKMRVARCCTCDIKCPAYMCIDKVIVCVKSVPTFYLKVVFLDNYDFTLSYNITGVITYHTCSHEMARARQLFTKRKCFVCLS